MFIENRKEEPKESVRDIVLKSIEPIVESLEHIEIDENELGNCLSIINDVEINRWDEPFIFNSKDERSVNYLALFSALSFHYWSEEGYWQRYYDGRELYGSYSLMLALTELIDQGIDITNAQVMANFTLSEFKEAFRGHNGMQLPYFRERHQIINQIGKILQEKFNGQFVNLLSQGEFNVNHINALLVQHFPCFRDTHQFNNLVIDLYKKSQEFIALMREQFYGKGLGEFSDLEDLTLSSDYKLPQIFEALGILQYKQSLLNKIKNNIPLEENSREAIEIRCATIHIGELVTNFLRDQNIDILSVDLSNIFWTHSQRPDLDLKPHPRIKGLWV